MRTAVHRVAKARRVNFANCDALSLRDRNVAALGALIYSFPNLPTITTGRHFHDCNEIVMIERSERVKSSTTWTTTEGL
jgi:hypothetical protein